MCTARGFEPLPPRLGATASAQEYKAQQARVYRIGVLLQGGPYYAAIDGLRDGLRELGLEEGKQFVLQPCSRRQVTRRSTTAGLSSITRILATGTIIIGSNGTTAPIRSGTRRKAGADSAVGRS